MSETILDKIVHTKLAEIEKCKSLKPLSQIQVDAEKAAPALDFAAAICKSASVALIAEVKKASPSQGVIRADFDPEWIAKIYQESGATCISVLTDESYFQGSLDYLTAIKNGVDIPVLRKDFIVDEYQVFEARAAGADAILLIAECLSPSQLSSLAKLAHQSGMSSLIELYNQENLPAVLDANPSLIGINNRDLRTFEVNLDHTIRLRKLIPAEIPVVGESGIFTADDVERLRQANVQAILVGQSLMEQDDIGAAVRKLMATRS